MIDTEIGTLGTERTNAIKVNIKDWKGKTFVDIRNWYKDSKNEWRPTQKGLFVAEQNISTLVTMLEQAEAALAKDKKK